MGILGHAGCNGFFIIGIAPLVKTLLLKCRVRKIFTGKRHIVHGTERYRTLG
jgi:hypothetical protein